MAHSQVRVPLNTACECRFVPPTARANVLLAVLAVQNMQANGTIAQDIEFKALEGSLSMMSKGSSSPLPRTGVLLTLTEPAVLNDVLDLYVCSAS